MKEKKDKSTNNERSVVWVEPETPARCTCRSCVDLSQQSCSIIDALRRGF